MREIRQLDGFGVEDSQCSSRHCSVICHIVPSTRVPSTLLSFCDTRWEFSSSVLSHLTPRRSLFSTEFSGQSAACLARSQSPPQPREGVSPRPAGPDTFRQQHAHQLHQSLCRGSSASGRYCRSGPGTSPVCFCAAGRRSPRSHWSASNTKS